MYEFYHHGIQGQKWGVRKYQNEDGSLTPAGRERYGSKASKAYDKLSRKIEKSKADDAKYAAARQKNLEKYTNKMDKKIAKAKNEDKRARLEAKKEEGIKNAKEWDRLMKAGDELYNKILTDYRDASLEAIDDKKFKYSEEFKRIKSLYSQLKLSDFDNYGSSTTTKVQLSSGVARYEAGKKYNKVSENLYNQLENRKKD